MTAYGEYGQMTDEKREYNYGLALLRGFACFLVILCHFWKPSSTDGIRWFFSYLRGYAVPIFMMMSFMLTQKALVQHERAWMKDRFERLIFPMTGWALIYWSIYVTYDLLMGGGTQHSINELLWQLVLGSAPQLNPPMWYQSDLVYITILFLIIILLFKNKYEYVLLFAGAAGLIVQYSGINMVFSPLGYEARYTLGRFAEMLPVAAAGFLISSKGVLEATKRNKAVAITASLILAVLAMESRKYFNPQGYGYQGIAGTLMSMGIIIFCYVIPLEGPGEKLKRLIDFATQYTLGIYCLHMFFGRILEEIIGRFSINAVKPRSFIFCIVLYLICFAVSWIGCKLSEKTKLRLLFN